MLTACLPGKKQEEKVIAQAQQATQQVAAERLAADMSNAAQSLMASNNLDPTKMTSLQSTELQTMACDDASGKKRVIAFVKRSAKVAKGGELPKVMANRLRDQLQSQFSEKSVGSSELVSGCNGDIESVALNSPVLVLDNTFAEKSQKEVASVNVESCPDQNGKTVPGVIITRTKTDGTTVVENKCGKAIDDKVFDQIGGHDGEDDPDYNVATRDIPDWKSQLSGTAGAKTSFNCIMRNTNGAGTAGAKCVEVDGADIGKKVQCDDSSAKEDFVVNPLRTNPSVSGPDTEGNCGKGWTGKVVARVKSKQCKVMIDGKEQEPAMIYEVANVAVKCSKDNVITQCPVGNGRFYSTTEMAEPVLLEPGYDTVNGEKKLVSKVATPSTPLPDQETLSAIMRLTNSNGVYKPSVDLRNVTDESQFSAALVKDMGSNARIINCNVVNNGCSDNGGPPDQVVVVLDRSASMGSKADSDKLFITSDMTEGYSCHAGLSNIFDTAKSAEACSAAKEFVRLNPHQPSDRDPKVMNFITKPWAGKNPPAGNSIELYNKMEDALVDKMFYKPYLQYALASGWDCSGRPKAGGTTESFPDDMFGTCSGAQSCDTCPGSCEKTKIDPVEGDTKVQRIQAADLIMKSFARMKLKLNTKVTIAEFINDNPSLKSITYCPPSHQVDGVCDLALERDALVNLFTRDPAVKQYVRPISQTVMIPTEKPDMPKIFIVPYDRRESGRMKKHRTLWGAPENMVMTGRYGVGDSDGDSDGGETAFEYANLKAVDQNGNTVPGKITVENLKWSSGIQESNKKNGCKSKIDCGAWFSTGGADVIVGMRHNGDENADTDYLYGTIKFRYKDASGVEKEYPITRANENISQRISESDKTNDDVCEYKWGLCSGRQEGIFYRTTKDYIVVGRNHSGDENGATRYKEARFQADCPPEICPVKICDVSECSKLPAIVDTDEWETWQDANAKGTVNRTGDYEKGGEGAYPKMTCYDSNGYPLPMDYPGLLNPMSFLDRLNPVSRANAYTPPSDGSGNCTYNPPPTGTWISGEDANFYYTYSMRKLRQDWITAIDAKANNTFDESIKDAPFYQDNNNYQFRSCYEGTIQNCAYLKEQCAKGDTQACTDLPQCEANVKGLKETIPDHWLTGVQPICVDNVCTYSKATFCSERVKKPNASSDNENLAACLDKCPANVYASTDIITCQMAKDIFSGQLSKECKKIKVPLNLNYLSPGYNKQIVSQRITRYIPAMAGEPGAIEAADNATVWGADFGGNTPLYKTIDAVLKDPDVETNMNSQKAVAFIVVTDGADTGDDSTTTKSLCGKDPATSFIGQLTAKNPNAKALFISLNDTGTANSECYKNYFDHFVSTGRLSSASDLIEDFVAVNGSNTGTVSGTSSLKSAETFCLSTYGRFTKFDDVPPIPAPGAVNRPAICRPYEVVR